MAAAPKQKRTFGLTSMYRGSSQISYSLLTGLIAVVAIGSVSAYSERMRCSMDNTSSFLQLGKAHECTEGKSVAVAPDALGPSSEPPVVENPGPAYERSKTTTMSHTKTAYSPMLLADVDMMMWGVEEGDNIRLAYYTDRNPAQKIYFNKIGHTGGESYNVFDSNLTSLSGDKLIAEATITRDNTDWSKTLVNEFTIMNPVMYEAETDPANYQPVQVQLTDSQVFVLSIANGIERLYAFDRDTAKEQWSVEFAGDIWGFGLGFMATDKYVALSARFEGATQKSVVVLDVADGREVMRSPYVAHEGVNKGGYADHWDIGGDRLFLTDPSYYMKATKQCSTYSGECAKGAIHAFDIASGGTHLWTSGVTSLYNKGYEVAVVGNHVIEFGQFRNSGYTFAGELLWTERDDQQQDKLVAFSDGQAVFLADTGTNGGIRKYSYDGTGLKRVYSTPNNLAENGGAFGVLLGYPIVNKGAGSYFYYYVPSSDPAVAYYQGTGVNIVHPFGQGWSFNGTFDSLGGHIASIAVAGQGAQGTPQMKTGNKAIVFNANRKFDTP